MPEALKLHSSIKPSNFPCRISSLNLSCFFIIIFLADHTRFAVSHIFIYSGCSQEKYDPTSPYQANLNYFLSSLVSSSSHTLYASFVLGNDTSSPPEGAVFGLYQCRGDLQAKDCSTCMATIISQIVLVCPYTYGATLQLDGCFVRYEHVDFLGKPDTSVGHKKCSKSWMNDAEFVRRRDDVLADLGAAGGFRVSSEGTVEGYAQCLGDLSGSDCSSCLSDAVVKVKSLCGSSAAGDVFLAQCYVRYWESGYYEKSSDSSNEKDDGRTVAIILGVVVGVVVLIVILSFCRKAIG